MFASARSGAALDIDRPARRIPRSGMPWSAVRQTVGPAAKISNPSESRTIRRAARFPLQFPRLGSRGDNHPREVIEAALAHVVRNKVEAAYARSDLFERRRVLMDDWAAYLDSERESAG